MAKQMRLDALRKVVPVSAIATMRDALQQAAAESDAAAAERLLARLGATFVSLEALETTGVGRVVAALWKRPSPLSAAVTDGARALVLKWRSTARAARRRHARRRAAGLAEGEYSECSTGTLPMNVCAVDRRLAEARREAGQREAAAERGARTGAAGAGGGHGAEDCAGAELAWSSDEKEDSKLDEGAAGAPGDGVAAAAPPAAPPAFALTTAAAAAAPGGRQARLTEMSKLTSLERVQRLHSDLKAALARKDETAALAVLDELQRTFVSTEMLAATLVGRDVSKLRSGGHCGEVRARAAALVTTWRARAMEAHERQKRLRRKGLAGRVTCAPGTVHVSRPPLKRRAQAGANTGTGIGTDTGARAPQPQRPRLAEE